jgi:hypothetical protein
MSGTLPHHRYCHYQRWNRLPEGWLLPCTLVWQLVQLLPSKKAEEELKGVFNLLLS